MCFKNQWYFGKKIITTDVSDAIIDIREKNKGYVISFEEENKESSDKIYKDILEIVKE